MTLGAKKAPAVADEVGAKLSGAMAPVTERVGLMGPQAKLADRTIKTLSKTAEKEGFEYAPKNVPEAFSTLSEQYRKRAKSVYKTIDDAVGGEFQPVNDKVRDLRDAVKEQSAVDPKYADALKEDLAKAETRKAEVLQQAKDSGVQNVEQILKKADSDYFKHKTLEKLTSKVTNASGTIREGNKPNVSRFTTILDNEKGKLQVEKSLGKDSLAELQQHAGNALKTTKRLKKAGKAAKWIGGPAAALGGAGALYKTLSE
jgi:hypothetical protein